MEFQKKIYKTLPFFTENTLRLRNMYANFFPASLKRIFEKKIIKVEIGSITSRIGFSYANYGWHPFVETLKEYIKNEDLIYRDSSLAKLYSNYTPGNLQEVFLDHLKNPIKPLNELPPVNDAIRNLWCLKPVHLEDLRNRQKVRKPEGWIFFGPHTIEYGENEFKRLIQIYKSIRTNGYDPEKAAKDMVNGYFLKRGEEKKFVLLQGNHRVSALKVLGYEYVDVVLRDGHPPVVDHAQLKKWTIEHGGIFSQEVVRELFAALYHEKGLEKARRCGVVPDLQE